MRRADSATPVILWVVVIFAAIIMVFWLVQNYSLNQVDIRSMDEDLRNLRYDIGLACQYAVFESGVRLYSPTGFFEYNNSHMCLSQRLPELNVSRCLPTPCFFGEGEIDFSEVSVIEVRKATGVVEVVGR